MLGSAVGMSQGLKSLVVLSNASQEVVSRVKDCFSSLNISVGDYSLVKSINTAATRTALTAALSLEQELSANNIPKEMINIAVEGVMTGVLIAYSQEKLGDFALSIIDEIQNKRLL